MMKKQKKEKKEKNKRFSIVKKFSASWNYMLLAFAYLLMMPLVKNISANETLQGIIIFGVLITMTFLVLKRNDD